VIIATNYTKHAMGLENYIAHYSKNKEMFLHYREMWRNNKNSLLFVLIETISRCNLRCEMCIHSVGYKQVKDMDDNLFQKVLDNIESMNIPSVCMNMTNEPLLDKHIFSRTRKVYEVDCVCDIMMNTNAVLLDENAANEILDSGLTRLLIGFDGYKPETYEMIRKGASYKKVMKNILNFIELKGKRGAALPIVRMSFVRTKINEAEIEDWVQFWKDKVDYLSIQEYYTHVLDSSKDHLLPETSRRKLLDYSEITCEQPFERVAIRGDGTVLPCCSILGVDLPVGNLWDRDLAEIWQGEPMEAIRNLFRERKWEEHPICSKCLKISSGLA